MNWQMVGLNSGAEPVVVLEFPNAYYLKDMVIDALAINHLTAYAVDKKSTKAQKMELLLKESRRGKLSEYERVMLAVCLPDKNIFIPRDFYTTLLNAVEEMFYNYENCADDTAWETVCKFIKMQPSYEYLALSEPCEFTNWKRWYNQDTKKWEDATVSYSISVEDVLLLTYP